MTKMTICRDALMPFENRTQSAKNYYEKDNKLRCKFCDKKFPRKDRLDKHEKLCEITCFNFLHKLKFGHTKPVFTNDTLVWWDGVQIPMNQIDLTNFCVDTIIPNFESDTETISDIEQNDIINQFCDDIDNEEDIINNFCDNISPPVYNDPSDLGIGDIIPYDNFEDNLSSDNEIDNEINNEVDNEDNNDINFKYFYDIDDELLLKVKKNEECDIKSYIINNYENTDLMFYKCKTCDKYSNTIYLQISELQTNEWLIDILYDYNDMDFMNWKANG
jgi:hypothetical protein